MKSKNAFWTATLLLVALGISGCLVEATQQEGPALQQSSQQPQQQEAGR